MKRPSYLLSLETSSDICSVALAKDARVLYEISVEMPYGQAAYLLGYVKEGLEKTGLKWKDLGAILINRGPGSFTGIRVGLAVSQGFSVAGGVPLFGLTGFEIYRSFSSLISPLIVLMGTRRNDCFVSRFRENDIFPAESTVMSWKEIFSFCQTNGNAPVIGNIPSEDYAADLSGYELRPLTAKDLISAYAFYSTKNKEFSEHPYYLRNPEIHGHRKSI